MFFKEENELLENHESDSIFVSKIGSVPILFTTAHTMMQSLEDRIKLSEPYTKDIAMYIK